MMKRGFLKYYILKLLGEEGLTGYGLMKRIEAETGFWKPSTGSMYPLLQSLEEQGLITHEGEEDRKTYHLTEQGRTSLADAYRAKTEILEGLKRAFEVFARIFGEEDVEPLRTRLESLLQSESLGVEEIPPSLQSRILILRHLLLSLPYERLSPAQMEAIDRTLEEALAKLSEFVEE
jgi:DNA-binding PadR family transcriptional regulator